MLGYYLKNKRCKVTNAPDDADVLIAKTAVNETESAQTTIIGEDTDVLILRCYHANSTRHNIYYTYDVKSGTKRKKIWYINQTKESLGFALLLTFRISKLRPV